MKRALAILIVSMVVLGLLVSGISCTETVYVTPTPTPAPTPRTVQDPVQKVLPSLVKVTARTANGIVQGSGFIVDSKKGYIITATHVIADAYSDSIKITLRNGVSQQATWVALQTTADISLLSTKSVAFPPISFGYFGYEVAPGQELFAIGMVGDSYTSVSGRVKTVQQDNAGYTIVTFESQAEQGMSGGPVVNEYGEGIGILSLVSITSGETVGIAVNQAILDGIIAFADQLASTPTPTPLATLPPADGTVPPCRFHGTVVLNGANVPDGTVVTVIIEGYGYPAGTTTVGGSSTYSIMIPKATGVSYEGKAVTFRVGSATAIQTSAWTMGGNVQVNLTASAVP